MVSMMRGSTKDVVIGESSSKTPYVYGRGCHHPIIITKVFWSGKREHPVLAALGRFCSEFLRFNRFFW